MIGFCGNGTWYCVFSALALLSLSQRRFEKACVQYPGISVLRTVLKVHVEGRIMRRDFNP